MLYTDPSRVPNGLYVASSGHSVVLRLPLLTIMSFAVLARGGLALAPADHPREEMGALPLPLGGMRLRLLLRGGLARGG